MKTGGFSFTMLIAWAWLELLRHDLTMKTRGFARVWSRLETTRTRAVCRRSDGGRAALEAIEWATTFYPKSVMCLQRSVVTARILRKCGFPANVAIGYRTAPFFSHAWVEIGDRVVNDERGYRQRLNILLRNRALSPAAGRG
ncbi:MAG TPA: lasso peptide biosynthesis B2 protein [Bryobacteraceae bacterium]|nr:lasso peptide biosynthesis B2 protein [Bryobacteraceae bacterium]